MALASVNEINSFLPAGVVQADETNIASINVSVERYIKAYLAKVTVTNGWTSVDLTPSTVRLVAAMLSASQLFFNNTGASSLELDERHFAQILYDRAIELLHGIVDGTIDIDGDSNIDPNEVSRYILGFWPNDETEPSFAVGMEFS
jgi:hypothetical protein